MATNNVNNWLNTDFDAYRATEIISPGKTIITMIGHHNNDDTPVMIKIYAKGELSKQALRNLSKRVNIDHPNLVRVLKCGQINEQTYAVFEFIQYHPITIVTSQSPKQKIGSCSLYEFINNYIGYISEDLAFDFLVKIASALNKLHTNYPNFNFGSITPGNILLELQTDGSHEIKFLDFGLPIERNNNFDIFLSPEELQNNSELNCESDIFMLGTLAYFILCRTIPTIPIDSVLFLRPGVAPGWNVIISKATEHNSANRYGSYSLFLAALEQIYELKPQTTGQKHSIKFTVFIVVILCFALLYLINYEKLNPYIARGYKFLDQFKKNKDTAVISNTNSLSFPIDDEPKLDLTSNVSGINFLNEEQINENITETNFSQNDFNQKTNVPENLVSETTTSFDIVREDDSPIIKVIDEPVALVSNTKSTETEIYVVQSGDTIWGIAKKHNIKSQELLELNNMKENDIIRPGMKLKINMNSNKTINETKTLKSNVKIENIIEEAVHVVQEGDTPWKISRKYNMNLQELLELNNLKSNDIIHPGTKLKIKK